MQANQEKMDISTLILSSYTVYFQEVNSLVLSVVSLRIFFHKSDLLHDPQVQEVCRCNELKELESCSSPTSKLVELAGGALK